MVLSRRYGSLARDEINGVRRKKKIEATEVYNSLVAGASGRLRTEMDDKTLHAICSTLNRQLSFVNFCYRTAWNHVLYITYDHYLQSCKVKIKYIKYIEVCTFLLFAK